MPPPWYSVPDAVVPLVYFAASAAVKLVISARHQSWSVMPSRAECVGRVTGLTVFPVKSLDGIRLDKADCTHTGPAMTDRQLHDREYLLTVGDEHRFVTARQCPRMLLVKTSVDGDGLLCFDAPGMSRLRLPIVPQIDTSRDEIHTKVHGTPVIGWSCGTEADDWFTRYLSKPNNTGADEQYHLLFNPGVDLRNIEHKRHLYVNERKSIDKLTYHDDGPFLLTTESSFKDLARRLAAAGVDPPITMDHFRPSIIVSGNTPAFDEDDWNEIFIGNAKFTRFMPCARCLLTTVDPVKGEIRKDGEPLKTLRSYRKIQTNNESPCFGVYLVCDRQATIRLDDRVYALRRRADWS